MAGVLGTQVERARVGPGSRVVQFASPRFDVSFWDLALGLFTGAALVVAPAAKLVPGEELAQVLTGFGVTHA
ncbi:hypothetical protein VM98_39295, partial [Streptomyces rubellomurinus subsp. indigoferus]